MPRLCGEFYPSAVKVYLIYAHMACIGPIFMAIGAIAGLKLR
jgi:hypothetical protein